MVVPRHNVLTLLLNLELQLLVQDDLLVVSLLGVDQALLQALDLLFLGLNFALLL